MESNLGWEQKRAYLIHSLFQDIPSSSFIPEDDSPPPVRLEPCSPLPPLNIEVIPKPNPHDEPEEFYQELEIKMKKFYRKLFYKDKTVSSEDIDDLSGYIVGYDSDDFETDFIEKETDIIEKEKQEFDEIVRKRAVVLEDLSHDNCNSQFKFNSRNEETVTQGEKGESKTETATKSERRESKDRSEDSTDYSVEFRVVTCVAEVHREDTDTDEAIIGYEEQKCPSPILRCTLQNQVLAAKEEATDINPLDLNDDSSDDGENRKSTPEVINIETASDSESSKDSIDIMRTNNSKRQSMGSIRLTSHSSASSPLPIDFGRSRSLDLDLDLVQVSTLNNTNLETSSKRDESASFLLKDSDSVHNNSINQNIEDTVKSKIPTEFIAKGFHRMTSTPKSKPASDVSNIASMVYGEDASRYEQEDDECEMDEVVAVSNPNVAVKMTPGDKGITETSKEDNESTDDDETYEAVSIETSKEDYKSADDEYETLEAVTISTPDMEVEKGSNYKETATRYSNRNSKDVEDKSFLFEKTLDKTERIDHGPATSTPKSRITFTQSVLSEATLDELNTARIFSSSNATGIKRALQELPEKSKRRKIDASNQTPFDDDVYWDEIKNDFFVGTPKILNVCSCRGHRCNL